MFGNVSVLRSSPKSRTDIRVLPNDVFAKALDVFFDGGRDRRALDLAEMTR